MRSGQAETRITEAPGTAVRKCSNAGIGCARLNHNKAGCTIHHSRRIYLASISTGQRRQSAFPDRANYSAFDAANAASFHAIRAADAARAKQCAAIAAARSAGAASGSHDSNCSSRPSKSDSANAANYEHLPSIEQHDRTSTGILYERQPAASRHLRCEQLPALRIGKAIIPRRYRTRLGIVRFNRVQSTSYCSASSISDIRRISRLISLHSKGVSAAAAIEAA